jgi:glucose-6-phosphate isomerase
LTIDEIADLCHCPEDVSFAFVLTTHLSQNFVSANFHLYKTGSLTLLTPDFTQIEMIYKIVQHMAANDRAIIAEGSCGSLRSIKVYLGECNVDEDEVAA